MLVHNDDEVYRVDTVWLGPPNATFPWRARYVSYGLGVLCMVGIFTLQRRLGIPLDVFSVGWALVATVVVVRFVGRRIGYERPLSHVIGALLNEIRTPRRATHGVGGALRAGHVRVRSGRPGTQPAPPRRPRGPR